MATTVEISDETWSNLNAQKQRPGESFDEVIQRLLETEEGDE